MLKMVVEPCSGTISCLFSRFALRAVLSCDSPHHVRLLLETGPHTGGLLWSCTLALSGGMGPPPGLWPGWEPPSCVRQGSQKFVRLFLSTGRKNTIKVLNNGAVSSGFDGAIFPALFRKMGLEKV